MPTYHNCVYWGMEYTYSLFVLAGAALYVLSKFATRRNLKEAKVWLNREWFKLLVSTVFVMAAYATVVACGLNPQDLLGKIGYRYELPLGATLCLLGFGSVSLVKKVGILLSKLTKKAG